MQETAPHRIDVHYHVDSPGYVQALRRIGVVEAGGVPLPRWSADRALAVLDRQGIAPSSTSISAPGVYADEPGVSGGDRLAIERESALAIFPRLKMAPSDRRRP
jgi:hypothetical protein